MIYDSGTPGDGVWHCPFTKAWVERMAKAAKHCEMLSAEYIEAAVNNYALEHVVPPGDFLDEEQDARGLPMSYCIREQERHRRFPTCCWNRLKTVIIKIENYGKEIFKLGLGLSKGVGTLLEARLV